MPSYKDLLEAIRAMIVAFDNGDAIALARAVARARSIMIGLGIEVHDHD